MHHVHSYMGAQLIPQRILHRGNQGGAVEGDDAFAYYDHWVEPPRPVGVIRYNFTGECWEFEGHGHEGMVKGQDVPPDFAFRDFDDALAYCRAYAGVLDGVV